MLGRRKSIMRTALRNAPRTSSQPVWIFIESDETWLQPIRIEAGINDDEAVDLFDLGALI